MSNPGWFDGMAAWNLTTECKEWTEDWRPCDYPFTGLSEYSPDAEHCYETFAEAVPDDYVYQMAQLIYFCLYLPFLLIFLNRVLLMLVDLDMLSFAVPFYPKVDTFTRKNRIINVHDQCNILSLLAVTIQMVRFIDLHAWQNVIPFTAYKVMGRLVRSLIVTTGSIIIKMWMNLISFWTSATTNSLKKVILRRDIKLMNMNIVLTWIVLLPVELYSILYTRDNCHEGCTNARVSCGSGIIISLLTILAMVLASRYVYLTAVVFQKIKTDGVHGVFSARFHEPDEDEKSRSGSTTSSMDDLPATIAPFHIRPSSENVQLPPNTFERTSSSFSSRNSEIDDLRQAEQLRNISANLTKDIDEIIWKRISRLSIFIFCLYLAAIATSFSDCSRCISSARDTFTYSSPPCTNADVFEYDSNLAACLFFFLAVIIYVPTRHKVLVLAEEKNTEKMEEVLTVEDRFDADTVVRYSEHGMPHLDTWAAGQDRFSEASTRVSRVSIAF